MRSERWDDLPAYRQLNVGWGMCNTGANANGVCSLGGIGCNVDHRFIWESGPGFPYVKERKGAVMPGMSESNGVTDIIRLRVVFALLPEGTVPSVVATIAGSEWATRHDEMEWMDATKKTWGLTHDDFRVISVEFPYRVAMPLFDPPSADA